MGTGKHYLFPPFRLDSANQQLWWGDAEVRLRRKTFEVLRHLIENHAQLVTKAALLDAVWPEVAVSDSMPAICVTELRKALGDDAATPRFVETVHGRGYRFIAQVTTTSVSYLVPRTPPAPRKPAPIMVGREAELAALSRLGEESASFRFAEILNSVAPSWLIQMPALLSDTDRKRLQLETQGITQQRMLREIAQALQVLTSDIPLVLLLEDLHWSDFATLEMISAVARRAEPARLLIIRTYRTVEI